MKYFNTIRLVIFALLALGLMQSCVEDIFTDEIIANDLGTIILQDDVAVHGTIRDANGAPLSGAIVKLKNTFFNIIEIEKTTNENGCYEF